MQERGTSHKLGSPLVNDQQVINVQLDSEDQTDDEQTVGDDRPRRGRFQSKGVKNEFLDIVGQRLALPEDIPGAVQEDMTHPSVVRNSERKVLPIHRLEITEDAIDDTQSYFQVRVSLVVLGSHDGMSAGDGLEDCLVGFVADALALDREMEEGLGAEISLVPEFGDNHRASARTIETFKHRVVEPFQRSGPDTGVPDYLGNEPHDGHDDVRIHRHLEHPGDTVRVELIAMPIGVLIEERGWLIRAGHEQLDVIPDVASVECTEPAQARDTTGFWSRPFLLLLEKIRPNHFLVLFRYFLCSSSKRIKKRRMREAGVWNGQL
jgi:hypothetical protein